jgi:hypothetical protein
LMAKKLQKRIKDIFNWSSIIDEFDNEMNSFLNYL